MGTQRGFTLVELMDRGGHYWDLGSQRHPALRERADPGSRGQSASRYPHARLGGERLHGPHGHPAGRPNGPDAGDRERPGTICGAVHRHRAHTARGWRASVERAYTYTSSSTGTFSITANGDGTTITVP
jgi:hypothetical protein